MQNICVPFVVVGQTTEPRVAFSQPAINFDRVQVGRTGRSRVELINDEDVPFDFALDKATYDATDDIIAGRGRPALVSFEPSRGTVSPQGRLALTASFRPDGEAAVNYTVTCNVKQKATPLTLNVKGEGYAVRQQVTLEAPDGSEVPLVAKVRNEALSVHAAPATQSSSLSP